MTCHRLRVGLALRPIGGLAPDTACRDARLICERRQAALRDQGRVEIPHRACGRVARVGEQRLALRPRARGSCARTTRAAGRPRREPRCGRAGPSRSASGIARIVRTFAVTSSPRTPSPRVAPRTSRPVFVRQRDAQTVDFHFGDVRDGVSPRPAPLRTRSSNALQLLLVVGVVEAEHRDDVLDRVESLDRPAGHALRRRIRS